MRLLSTIRPVTSLALAASNNRNNKLIRPYSVHRSFSQDIIDRYDAFILDQFGVLHNGVSALDGAVELCRHLHETHQKKLIILSNTSAPADRALAKLPKLGFNAHHFVGAITSGEESSHYVRATYGSNVKVASKVLMLTWDASKPNNPRLTAPPEAYLERCGNIQVATLVADADFVLLHGSEIWYRGNLPAVPLGDFIETGDMQSIIDPIFEECVSRNLPLVCANPDLIVQTPTGGTAYMPGRMAQRYKEMGGDCRVFGKPDVEHFEACIQKLGLDKSQVAHVGDSLHHDIAGATAAGIPNVFVTSGIHSPELQAQFGELPDLDVLDQLFYEEGSIIPTHVVSAFRL